MVSNTATSTCLVTGGGRGIGRAVALALAATGAHVSVIARTAAEIEATAAAVIEAGGRAAAYVCDVTDLSAVEQTVRACESDFGPIELLVNNAGTHGAIGLPWEVDPALWWQDVEINLRGTFNTARAVLPGMIARGHGRIVNLVSGAALEPRPYSSAYAAAKSAVLHLTQSFDAAASPRGVRLFAVHPGGVRTQLTESIMRSQAGQEAYPEWPALAWQPAERSAAAIVQIASGLLDHWAGRFLDVTRDLESALPYVPESE